LLIFGRLKVGSATTPVNLVGKPCTRLRTRARPSKGSSSSSTII